MLWPWNPVDSRSLKMTPFDMPSIITYCHSLVATDLSVVFLTYLISKIPWPWNWDQGSVKVINTGTIQQIGYGFLWVFYRNFILRHTFFEIFTFEKYSDLETGVRGHRSSLKMTLFDTSPMTSYWCSIITKALCRAFSEIFNVEKYDNIEIPVMGQSRTSGKIR